MRVSMADLGMVSHTLLVGVRVGQASESLPLFDGGGFGHRCPIAETPDFAKLGSSTEPGSVYVVSLLGTVHGAVRAGVTFWCSQSHMLV